MGCGAPEISGVVGVSSPVSVAATATYHDVVVCSPMAVSVDGIGPWGPDTDYNVIGVRYDMVVK